MSAELKLIKVNNATNREPSSNKIYDKRHEYSVLSFIDEQAADDPSSIQIRYVNYALDRKRSVDLETSLRGLPSSNRPLVVPPPQIVVSEVFWKTTSRFQNTTSRFQNTTKTTFLSTIWWFRSWFVINYWLIDELLINCNSSIYHWNSVMDEILINL